MACTRHKVKSCCGSATFVFEVDKPIKKQHVPLFESAGYNVPKSFVTAGVFYVTIGGLIATSSFGSGRCNVKCHGANCIKLLDDFAVDLDRIVHS